MGQTQLQKDIDAVRKAMLFYATREQVLGAWHNIRVRYRNRAAWERYRTRVEDALFANERGCEIPKVMAYRHRYKWHPVMAFTELRREPGLSHLSDDIIAAEVAVKFSAWDAGRSFLECKTPGCNVDDDFERLANRHGVQCSACVAAKPRSEMVCLWRGADRVWLCEECVLSQRRSAWLRAERDRIQWKRFKRAEEEKRRQKEADREAKDAVYRARREAARAERKRASVERAAAYELVKELGLIDRARQQGGLQ